MEILFYRRSSPAQKRKGTCSIQCRLTIDGERAELGSTHIEVAIEHFDDTTKRVLHLNPNAQLYNLRLQQEYETRVLAIYNDFVFKRITIRAERIKKVFLGQEDNDSLRLMDCYDIYLKAYEKRTKVQTDDDRKKKKKRKKRLSLSSLRPLRNCRTKMLEYLIQTQNINISIGELDHDFFEEYEQYLWNRDYEESYIVKQLRVLTTITRWLKRKKLISNNPFAGIEVENEEAKDPNKLDLEQFEAWCNFEFSNKYAQLAADIFKLYCRTGFHYADLREVVRNPDLYFRKGLDGNIWIYKPREKTEEIAKIPIEAFNKSIKPVIDKFGGWKNVPIPSNNTMNDWLKICVAQINFYLPQELKIYEGLSVKHGRTTFAYYWINVLGRTKESLLPILGRKSDWGLDRYVRIDERAVIAQLKIMENENSKIAG